MRSLLSHLVLGLAVCSWSVGCDQKGQQPVGAENSADAQQEHEHGAGHEHPAHGPHEGDLIELGDEEYHAEFVHDEKTCDVTIYVLDSSAKEAVAIEATEIVINLKHDGKPLQHRLKAEPQEGDAEGKSSRFVSKSNDGLCHEIDEGGADARLQITIAGKSYTGEIVHDHDHDHAGHDHKHDEK